MLPTLQHFYLNASEPNKSCLLALRSLILTHHAEITETVKYGMPCFCYQNRMFCYLWVDKKTHKPYILLVDGKHIDHPALEAGTRTRMKILRIEPTSDLQIELISVILQLGIEHVKK